MSAQVINKVRFNTQPIEEEGMRQIGEAFLTSMDARLSQGFNLRDEPAKPLEPRYARWKTNRGLQGIRDWFINGFLRKSLQVLSVVRNRVTLGSDNPDARTLLAKNQAIEPQFGVSPRDLSGIIDAVRRVRTVGKAQKGH